MLLFIVPFCSIFIIVGGWLTVSVVKKIMLGCQAASWPTARGVITRSESKDTSDSESSSREIKVRYSYNVDGQQLEGTVIHPVYGSSSFEQAHAGLEQALKVGKAVRVHYDPAKPQQSTLSTGFLSGSLAGVFGGLLFFGAGVGFLGTFWFAIAGKMNIVDSITFVP